MKVETISEMELRLKSREHPRILIVDDHPDFLKLIKLRLRPFQFEIKTATSAEEGLTILSVWPADLVITDLRLPGMSGMDMFTQIQHDNPLLPVIILTAHGTIEDAVAATHSGVVSYLTKPFESEVLLERIQGALVTSAFTEEKAVTSHEFYSDPSWRSKIISNSPFIKGLLTQIAKLADSRVLVMFSGESGTGKVEMARALHKRSERYDSPLIEVSCSSYADEVLDAEIFGLSIDPNKGSAGWHGKLLEAEGGSLLLRDFDEASRATQRIVLQSFIDREATAINSNKKYKFDVRLIITSSVTDAEERIDNELWDLAYRLGATELVVPPLSERREDIAIIANHYLQQFSDDKEIHFATAALNLLTSADWPGNIRQLIAVVLQCARLTNTNIISEALVSSRLKGPSYNFLPLSGAQREFERNYLTDVLKVTSGNVTRAAALAKRNRTEFHRLIKKHRIDAKEFRRS